MKIRISRGLEFIDVDNNNITIIIKDTKYTLNEGISGELEVLKIGMNDENIRIEPCVANKIKIT